MGKDAGSKTGCLVLLVMIVLSISLGFFLGVHHVRVKALLDEKMPTVKEALQEQAPQIKAVAGNFLLKTKEILVRAFEKIRGLYQTIDEEQKPKKKKEDGQSSLTSSKQKMK